MEDAEVRRDRLRADRWCVSGDEASLSSLGSDRSGSASFIHYINEGKMKPTYHSTPALSSTTFHPNASPANGCITPIFNNVLRDAKRLS